MELLMDLLHISRPVPPRSVTFNGNRVFHSIEDIRPFYLQAHIPRKPVGSSSSVHSIFHAWDSREQNNSSYSLASTLRSPEQDIVTFSSPNDPSNPMNWSSTRKMFAVMAICLTTFTVSFSSSIFASAVPVTTRAFGVSTELMTLSISLYVLGYAAGPLLWAPLSEAIGRRLPFIAAYFFFTVSQLPVAVATNPETILVFRFLAGACGSATLVIPAAMVVDFLAPVPRSKVIGLYMFCVFLGPVIGPVAGAWVVEDRLLGWRYTAWIVLFMSTIFGIFAFFAIPESYPEILLQKKAARLRQETQNWALHSKRDEKLVGLGALLDTYMKRPVKMIFREPILIFMSLYNALVYGLLYLIFFAYPYCFQGIRGWPPAIASLPFLAMLVGILLAFIGQGIFNNGWWMRRFAARGQKLCPEDRLPPMAVSAVLLPTGLFLFAWTSSPNVHWAPQVVSGVLVGAGILLNLLSSISYLIDVYLQNANSALAANTCIRSATAAAFPLFAEHIYKRLGSEWATSLMAFLCLAMVPVPWVFWTYGKRIRGWSRYGVDA